MSSSPSSSSSSEAPAQTPFGWVLDVPCAVEFILGTTSMRVRDCARLSPQSIIRLRQSAGADLEVRAGGIPMATGEVVIVEETVGLRISRILPPAGRELA
jgi:flagellar motor switch protein FliN/FliY